MFRAYSRNYKRNWCHRKYFIIAIKTVFFFLPCGCFFFILFYTVLTFILDRLHVRATTTTTTFVASNDDKRGSSRASAEGICFFSFSFFFTNVYLHLNSCMGYYHHHHSRSSHRRQRGGSRAETGTFFILFFTVLTFIY